MKYKMLEYDLEILDSIFEENNEYIITIISATIEKIIRKAFEKGKIAIVGNGVHARHLQEDFELLCNVDLIDEKYEIKNHAEDVNSRTYGYDKINEYDCLIIGSKKYNESLKNKINKYGFDGTVVDIYQELGRYGWYVPTNYFSLEEYPYIIDIIGKKRLDFDSKDFRCLENMIYCAIHRRDFLCAKDYLQIYKKSDEQNAENLNKIIDIIENLTDRIKKLFQKRKKRDIVAFWIDALRYKLSKDMAFLNQCRDEGIDFNYAYSSTCSTRDTYGVILHNCDEIDLFCKEMSEYEFVEMLDKHGYEGYRVNGLGSISLHKYKIKEDRIIIWDVSSSKIMWDTIMQIIESDKPAFIICHIGLETHPPFISPWSATWDNYTVATPFYQTQSPKCLMEHNENVRLSAKYCDEELKFFSDIMGANVTKIYFSDHGVALKKKTAQYMEDMVHIPFVIVGPEIPHILENKVVLTKDMKRIVEKIIEKSDWIENPMGMEHVCVYGIDAYDLDWIKYLMQYELYELGIQYNGVRTNQDLYIINALGEEKYYVYPQYFENKIQDVKYQDRIQKLKSLLKKKHIDIEKHPKFVHTTELYEALGRTFVWRDEDLTK